MTTAAAKAPGVGGAARRGRASMRDGALLLVIVAMVGGAALADDADDLRDDLAGLFDQDVVAQAQVEALDLIPVVQRRPRHRGAGQLHRLEQRHRGDGAGAADVDLDVQHTRGRLLGGELVGDRPPRRAAGLAEFGVQGQFVYLDHQTVDLVLEVVNPRPQPARPASSEGVGIANARARLQLLFGARATLTLDLSDAARAVARVRLPVRL